MSDATVPLEDVLQGTLFDLELSALSRVSYRQEERGFSFILPRKEASSLGKEVFFLPDDRELARPLRINFSSGPAPYGEGGKASPLSIIRGYVPEDTYFNKREDFRCSMSFDVFLASAPQKGEGEERKITLLDMSALGLLFVSDEPFQIGEDFSFTLPNPAYHGALRARVIHKVPLHINRKNAVGYGCKFVCLDNRTESEVRKFIFQQEVLHKKCETEQEE